MSACAALMGTDRRADIAAAYLVARQALGASG